MLAAQATSLSGARLADSIPVSACSQGGFSKELSRREKFSPNPSSKETYLLCICFLGMSGCHVFLSYAAR